MRFLSFFLACLALVAQTMAAVSLRSAFVPAPPALRADTAMMGSIQNAPNHAGKILGIPVGTAAQKKQAIMRIEKEHRAEVEANKKRKAEVKAGRDEREQAGLAKAQAAQAAKAK